MHGEYTKLFFQCEKLEVWACEDSQTRMTHAHWELTTLTKVFFVQLSFFYVNFLGILQIWLKYICHLKKAWQKQELMWYCY